MAPDCEGGSWVQLGGWSSCPGVDLLAAVPYTECYRLRSVVELLTCCTSHVAEVWFETLSTELVVGV
jgi:hypothetical protein